MDIYSLWTHHHRQSIPRRFSQRRVLFYPFYFFIDDSHSCARWSCIGERGATLVSRVHTMFLLRLLVLSLSLCLFLSVSVSPLLVDYMLFSLSTVAPQRDTRPRGIDERRRYIHRGWRSRCRAANGQTKQTRRRFRAITHVTNSAHRWECKRATAAPDAAYAPADCFLTRPPSSTVAPPSSHCPITGRAPKFAASSHATRRRARSPIFLFHESLFAIFRCRESHWW